MTKRTIVTCILVSALLVGCASDSASISKTDEAPVTEIPIEQRIEEPAINGEDTLVEDEESAKKQEKEELEEKPEPETVEKPKEETKEAPKETSKEEQKPVEKPAQETSSLPNDKKSWWFKRNSDHLPPGAQSEIDIAKYDAYYLGNTKEKKIYLTFDEGYENGYTPKILDVLKEHNVKAAFFVTKPYIQSQPDLVKRMVEEGHIVGNHSVTHPSLPDKTDEEVKHEILETARYFEEVTSTSMPLFFRPPAGEYSERTLQITKDLGYKTIFWSMAYKDWDVNNQPGKQAAYEHIVQNHHPGAIILLHAVSSSNTEALGDMLKYLRDQGYTFASLNEL
mgnify:CR=1 FL=1